MFGSRTFSPNHFFKIKVGKSPRVSYNSEKSTYLVAGLVLRFVTPVTLNLQIQNVNRSDISRGALAFEMKRGESVARLKGLKLK